MIDDLSKRLLELEIKSNHLIKSKCLKLIVKKYYQHYKMTGKQYFKKDENTYCLVCKKKRDDKKTRGVALAGKIAPQRSLYTVCTSRKSTFLKGIKKKNWPF